jgi:hypothetical protein
MWDSKSKALCRYLYGSVAARLRLICACAADAALLLLRFCC